MVTYNNYVLYVLISILRCTQVCTCMCYCKYVLECVRGHVHLCMHIHTLVCTRTYGVLLLWYEIDLSYLDNVSYM